MPTKKHTADELQAMSLQGSLVRRGLTHLRVRRHGVLLIVESGPAEDPVPHVRFRRHGAHIWTLEMATHTGAWEPTFFRGQIEHLVDMVQSDFPWTVAPLP
jgi:hypothetical protein